MRNRIVIKGYYGFGNLGDDILMLTTFNWVRENFPQHEILICSDSQSHDYLFKMFGECVKVVRSNENINVVGIVHGGGGTYFDFKQADMRFWILNKIIAFIGINLFKKLYQFYRKIKKNPGLTSGWRVGIGLGIGTYTSSSRRFYADMVELADCNFLMVRDNESAEHAKNLGLTVPIMVSTDLAFLGSHWLRKIPIENKISKKIGFILRDWEYDKNSYLSALMKVGEMLTENGFFISFYSFDQNADVEYVKTFTKKYPVLVWTPVNMSFDEYIGRLAECSLMVTSRAHGAIISACLGIPSVCLAIEPKLEKIAQMLQRSSILISRPFLEDKIIGALLRQMNSIHQLKEFAFEDVEENCKKITDAMTIFRQSSL